MPVDPKASKRLYLFDIDGTLITSGGAGERAFHQAVEELCGGLSPLEGVNFAGNTDTGIAREVLMAAGMEPTQEKIMALLDAYLSRLADRMHRHQGRLLPGIIPLLDRMRERPDTSSDLSHARICGFDSISTDISDASSSVASAARTRSPSRSSQWTARSARRAPICSHRFPAARA
jgi:beta-phosphoglucomutase-like phosphatase (HAD superfamily)